MQTQAAQSFQTTYDAPKGPMAVFVVGERYSDTNGRVLVVTKVAGSAAVFGVPAAKCRG